MIFEIARITKIGYFSIDTFFAFLYNISVNFRRMATGGSG